MNLRYDLLATLTILFLVGTIPAFGVVWTVDDDGPADFSLIQEAIDWSWDGDTIQVLPGTYNESIYFNSRAITLTSLDPNDPNTVATTIIDPTFVYSVTFDFNEGVNSVLTGFTLINGGINCLASSPTITKNIIRDCTTRGIDGTFNAAPTISENAITNNNIGISGCHGLITDNIIGYRW